MVAVPVAPNSTCNWLRSSVDELVVAHAPQHFYAVGQFYDHFSQTTDEEVVALLGRAARENGTGMVRSPGSDSDAAMTN